MVYELDQPQELMVVEEDTYRSDSNYLNKLSGNHKVRRSSQSLLRTKYIDITMYVCVCGYVLHIYK